MLYWLIPYLVAYNASDTGNWKYGPEHLFKAEVRSDIASANDSLRTDVNMFITCRPMNSSCILCRVESAIVDVYDFSMDSDSNPIKDESNKDFLQLGNATFQVEFDEMGPRQVTFLNTKGSFRQNMILVIVGQLNIGTDLSDKKPEKEYFLEEKSVNGICETSFDMRKTRLPYEEEETAAIEGFNFDVPSFPERLENEKIIIEKKKKMNACSVKPNYFLIGSTDGSHLKQGVKVENNITRSKSIMSLGKNGFSSYTENEGMLEIKSVGMASKIYSAEKAMKGKIVETIRLKFVAIRPATEKL